MGRHTASREPLHTTLSATLTGSVRRGGRAVARAVSPRSKRSMFGTGAAVAAIALTASTTAAALVGTGAPASSATSTSTSSGTTTQVRTASATAAAADAATVDAAQDALVQAQYVTSEGASGVPAEKLEKINETRTHLSQAISDVEADSLASLSGTTTEASALDVEPALTSSEVLPSSDVLSGRDGGTASRSLARTPLTAAVDADDSATTDATTTDGAAAAGEPAADEPAADAETATAGDATAEPADVTESADADAKPAETDAPTTEVQTLTAELTALLDETETGTVAVVPGPTPEEVAAKKAAAERKKKEQEQRQLDEWASSTEAYGNGQIPASALCELSFAPGQLLRCDAAHQVEKLNAKYREAFGSDISVTDSYRSYGSQVAVKGSRGYFAAAPGTSNHGWGQALDLGGGIQGYGSAQYQWMRDNAPGFGWDNPEWARAGGAKNEPWHWEYGVQP
ncbi:D-alanyl-D-alanine carboxypeptidase family protein [Cellulosimicrobium terreum]|nr:D-alanyl-D-alanine carboxypeptidase family protein [Cellulosimicrobium terreum]